MWWSSTCTQYSAILLHGILKGVALDNNSMFPGQVYPGLTVLQRNPVNTFLTIAFSRSLSYILFPFDMPSICNVPAFYVVLEWYSHKFSSAQTNLEVRYARSMQSSVSTSMSQHSAVCVGSLKSVLPQYSLVVQQNILRVKGCCYHGTLYVSLNYANAQSGF